MYFIFLFLFKILLVVTFLVTLVILIYKMRNEPRAGVCRCKTRLDGKIALVTGGNSGIGFETAKNLAKRGARVIIADFQNAEQSVAEIKRLTGNKNVEYRELHLESLSSVIKFAEEIRKSVDRLDILVNNAGTGVSDGRPTEDGNNIIMQVNYLGPFLLTALLLDKLIASKPSRIVITASGAYEFAKLKLDDLFGIDETNAKSYSNSKLCDILWMKALAKRLPRGVTVNSLHPGIVKTNLLNSIRHPVIRNFLFIAIGIFFKTPKQGAQTSIHLCAAEELENSTGHYYADCKIAKINKEDELNDVVEVVWNKTIANLREYYRKRGEEFRPCESIRF